MKRLHKPLGPDGYQVVRSNDAWPDHVARYLTSAAMLAWCKPDSVADPACGDASIVSAAARLWPIQRAFLNDISKPQIADLWGKDLGVMNPSLSTMDAVEFINGMDHVDTIVLTEILEHLEDPAALVRAARAKATHLVASSPINETEGQGNHEHVWSFSVPSYRQLLEGAGWAPVAYQELRFYPPFYDFQLWVCR